MATLHAETYKRFLIGTLVHKARLRMIVAIFLKLPLAGEGTWGDFGCSDGFILGYLRARLKSIGKWKMCGFDSDDELLKLAARRKLPKTQFEKFDLSGADYGRRNTFDIVTCFETLEHTGNYRTAFDNLYSACKNSGYIVISVPNEIGFPGIVKFIGRKMLRKNAYGNFFDDLSERDYCAALLRGGDIECFREKYSSGGWGPHLGFDYRNFEKYILNDYINQQKCRIIKRYTSFFNFNILYLIKKCD